MYNSIKKMPQSGDEHGKAVRYIKDRNDPWLDNVRKLVAGKSGS
jgi:hypothetical protein